jgi:hypothetical protein
MRRKQIVPSLLACVALIVLTTSHVHAAGGAYAVDDSEIGKPGECKVESWASFADNKDFVAATAPACVVSLGRPIEFGAQLQRSRSGGDWGTGLTLKAKTNVIPLEGNRFGLAISGSTGWDLVTGENTGGAINIPLTFEVSEQFKVNLNAGYLYESGDNLSWFTWGAGFEWNFVKPLTFIAEVYGQSGNLPPVALGQPPAPNSIREPRVQAGLRYTPVDNIDIDLIYGRNITGEDANWVTLGLNVRF